MIFLCSLFFATGLYFLLAEIFKIPKFKRCLAVLRVTKSSKTKFSLDDLVTSYAVKFSKYVKINPYRRQLLKNKIIAADLDQTPEEYVATAISKTLVLVLLAIIAMFVFPLLSLPMIVTAIAVFSNEYQKASKIANKKKQQIESQLPRFASTIAQELHSTRDVLRILRSYKESSEGLLKKEIEITIADMNSGNQETALLRLQSRIGSTMLSDIVRGLIAVIRGDDGIVYFEMLAHDFKKIELQKLKMIAVKRLSKMKKYSFAMLICLIVMYLVVLGYEIVSSFGKMF